MRLKEDIKDFLSRYAEENFSDAEVFLFGARVNFSKKGEDLDAQILTEKKLSFSDLTKMRISFYIAFGEQKIDLVNFTCSEKNHFKNIALEQAIEL